MAADIDAAASAQKTPQALWLLLIVVYINIAGFSLLLPLLPFYGQQFAASPMQIATLFAAFSFGNLFGETYWGRMSDRIGRRRVLVASIACAALSYVAFAFAPNLITAIALRIVSGFFSGNLSVVQGYIADITPPERRAARIGLFGAAFNLGFVTGPAIGGLLARPELGVEGYRPPIFFAALLAAAAALWAFAFLKDTQPTETTRRKAGLSAPQALRFAASHAIIGKVLPIGFIGVACFASMEAIFGLWTEAHSGWGPREVGLAFIAVGLAGCVTQAFLIGPLSQRFDEARMIVAGLLILILSTALQPIARNPAVTVALMSLLMIGHSFAFPNIVALVSRCSPPDAQGSLLGLNLASTALGRIVGPPLMGLLFSSAGPDAPYFTAAALLAIAALLALQVASTQHALRRAAQPS